MIAKNVKYIITLIFIGGVSLGLFFGFNVSRAQAAGFMFNEDFSATDYMDNLNTTANWSAGELALKNDGSDSYTATGALQSFKVNPANDRVARVRLLADDIRPQGTSIEYFVSANGGVNWEKITPIASGELSDSESLVLDIFDSKTHIFVSAGNDFRWKAVLSTSDNTISPVIFSLLIAAETIEETMIKVLSPNGGEVWRSGEKQTIKWQSNNPAFNISFILIKLINGKESDLDNANFAVSYNNTGALEWEIPDLLEGEFKIMVTGADSSNDNYFAYDKSDGLFRIIGVAPVVAQCKPDSVLLRPPGDFKVYVIINCQKKWIKTVEEFEMAGYEWSDIQEVSVSTLNDYSDYIEAAPAAATLLRGDGDYKVYRILGGKRLWIPTAVAFNAQGLPWNGIQQINSITLSGYPRAKLLRIAGGSKVYYITEAGYKRHIINSQAFLSYGNKWEDVIDVDFDILNSFPDSALIRGEGDYKVYKLGNGQKHWIKSAEAFNKLGFDWNNIAPVNLTELNAYPVGASIE